MKKGFKRIWAIVLCASLTTGITACSDTTPNTAGSAAGGSNASTAEKTAENEKPYAGQTIRLVACNHMWVDAMKSKIPEFEKNTGIKVSMETYAEDQLNQKLSIEFTSGNSNIDVFMTRPIQEKKLFYKNKWYETLDSYIKDSGKAVPDWDYSDFMPGLLECHIENGELCSVPLTNEFQALFYRTDLFEQANLKVPTTFDELEECAKVLTDPSKEQYGIVARGNMGAAVPVWGCFLYGWGGDYLKDGKCDVTSEAGVESLKYYGRLLKNYGPPGVMNMGWPQCVAVFAAGNAAMYIEGNAQMAQFGDPTKSKIADKFGVAVFPAGPKAHKTYQTATWGLAIAKTSNQKDAAWNFIEWSTSKENMKVAQLSGLGMSRASVWDDKEVQASLKPGFAEVVKETAEIGVPYYAPPMIATAEARDILGVPVVKSIESGGTGDVESWLKDASDKVDALLAQE